ncbi:MAG: hypothetical protein NTV86_19555 [Planctomycetota bacterium]|nr:hypothetical protein [Planctomycetota bacterium]
MKKTRKAISVICILGFLLAVSSTAGGGQDILIADFEGPDYGAWQATGEAFSAGPVKGTLPDQHPVSGFVGKGLVNSYLHGDGAAGTLTSPEFTIERDYIVFLIGGGAHKGTCLELLVDAKAVAACSGMNDELLSPNSFDVTKLKGRKARLRIVDSVKDNWGHVNVDQIVQSDTRPKVPTRGTYTRQMTIQKKYLIVPIHTGAEPCGLELEVAGKPVRRYDAEIAPDARSVSFWAYFTIEPYKGQPAVLRAGHAPEEGFALIRQPGDIRYGRPEAQRSGYEARRWKGLHAGHR